MFYALLLTILCLYQVNAWQPFASEKTTYVLEEADKHFKQFIEAFEKEYDTKEEYKKRFEIFKQNLKDINERNGQNRSEFYGITQFSDLTHEEFVQHYTGFKGDDLSNATVELEIEALSAPENWDWRQHGVVTGAKNQGRCGSCWAFSAAGCVEGQYAKNHNKLVSFSEQQPLDCTRDSYGCRGGLPHLAFNSAAQMGGWDTEAVYSYRGTQGKCRFRANAAAKITGGKQYRVANEEQLKELVHSYGPVSIAMQVGSGFAHYRGGIATARRLGCSPHGKINHAVLLVGFGTESGEPYWIIKNSYGKVWGESGFFKLERGRNACNIMEYTAVVEVE